MAVRPKAFRKDQQKSVSLFALCRQDKREAAEIEAAEREAKRKQWEQEFVVKSLGLSLFARLRKGENIICTGESKEFKALQKVMEHPRNAVECQHVPSGQYMFTLPKKAA